MIRQSERTEEKVHSCRWCKRPVRLARNWRDCFCDVACKDSYTLDRIRKRQGKRVRLPELDYGPEFRRVASIVREKDRDTCVICGRYPARIVDHIIPLRVIVEMARRNNENGHFHDEENLWTICPRDSGVKTAIDKMFKKADILGFGRAMHALCGSSENAWERVLKAGRHYDMPLEWTWNEGFSR